MRFRINVYLSDEIISVCRVIVLSPSKPEAIYLVTVDPKFTIKSQL